MVLNSNKGLRQLQNPQIKINKDYGKYNNPSSLIQSIGDSTSDSCTRSRDAFLPEIDFFYFSAVLVQVIFFKNFKLMHFKNEP